MPDAELFVSYSSQDRARVVVLVDYLRAAGVSVWIDQGGIREGSDWAAEIIDALDACDICLMMLSHASCVSEEVFRELSYASGRRKRLIAARLEPVLPPGRFQYHLAGLQWVDLFDRSVASSGDALLRALDLARSRGPDTSSPAPPSGGALPVPPTRLVGRESERNEVLALLHACRLVTLTGPGGTGKTRLSIAVAAEACTGFPDGTRFVELASISQPELVPSAIAQALGVREAEGGDLERTLRHALRSVRMLLVIDNFEQVAAAGPFLSGLLVSCPGLKLLVSSRVALHLYGEQEYPVPPLSLPDPQALPPLDELARFAALELLVSRAAAVKPGFALTSTNAADLVEICRRLDGLPLALELAAARLKLLSPSALLARLQNRLQVLTGGARDLPARQQTLRAAIAWSHDLLEEPERVLFRRLAAFSGGCTLEAAEAVCSPFGTVPLDVFDGLASLIDKSLIRQEESAGGEPRFEMLETIREFALEMLQAAGEREAAGAAHAAYYSELGESAAPELFSTQQAACLDRLEVENDNLRAALSWAQERDEPRILLALAASLWYFWAIRGHFTEGRRWLEVAVHGPRSPAAGDRGPRYLEHLGTALNAAAMLTYFQGDYERMVALAEECVDLTASGADFRNRAFALAVLGVASYCAGRKETGIAAGAAGLELAQRVGIPGCWASPGMWRRYWIAWKAAGAGSRGSEPRSSSPG